MSRFFVNDAPVAIYEFDPSDVVSGQPPNVIWIKSKMDLQTDAKVKTELSKLNTDTKTLEASMGGYAMAMLIHNIVKWDGPDLSSVPCTPENIRRMDSTDPYLSRVFEELVRRNARTPSPNPKSAGASTFVSAGAADLRATVSVVEDR